MKQVKLNITGETLTFTRTVADTNGQSLEMIVYLPAGRREAPPKHIHPYQAESFEAISGRLGVWVNNEKIILEPGQTHTVSANTPHGWFAAGKDEIKFKTVFEPALNIEWMLTETFASANRNNSLRPSVFEGAYIISQMKGEFYLAGVPRIIQRTVFPFIAAFGKLFGLTGNIRPKS